MSPGRLRGHSVLLRLTAAFHPGRGRGHLEPSQGTAQDARDLHLRAAHPLADLALGQVVHEAQLHGLSLVVRQPSPCRRDRFALGHRVVGRVLVSE
jgi:hypothetical protein